jgi:predicted transcriptional regulator
MERPTKIVLELLSKGCSQVEVAELTGNTESAISQVATKYATQLAVSRAEVSVATGAHGSKLDRLEALAAERLEGMMVLETDTMKLAKIFQILNGAIRRDSGEKGGSAGAASNTTNTQVIVQLSTPAHLAKRVSILTNSNNDVVRVGDRDLTAASMSYVSALAGISHKEVLQDEIRRQAFDDILSAPLAR